MRIKFPNSIRRSYGCLVYSSKPFEFQPTMKLLAVETLVNKAWFIGSSNLFGSCDRNIR
jgi:hypothetical protein